MVCDRLEWDAAAIRAVEIGWRAETEPGFLTLRWSGLDAGVTKASAVSTVYLADGEWHTLLFDVSGDPRWRGTIQSVRLEVNSAGYTVPAARMGLAYVRALPEVNLVPNADQAMAQPGGALFGGWRRETNGLWSVATPRVRPRATYRLDFAAPVSNAVGELQLLDHRGQSLLTVPWSGTNAVVFTAPPLTVTARLTLREDGVAPLLPRLLLVKPAPLFDLPDPWWHASWIWSRQGMGPMGAVWLRREFELPDRPVRAELTMTADDASRLWINGAQRGGNAEWSKPVHHDLTSLLRKGRNEIVVQVDNQGAWGGLLLEMCAESAGGTPFRLFSDSQWTCLEQENAPGSGSVSPPAGSITNPAVVLGQPPMEPWGLNVGYIHTGPSPQALPNTMGLSSAVPGVKVKLAGVRVKGVGRRARIEIDGKAYPPFTSYVPLSFTGAPEGKGKMVSDFAAQGIHLLRMPVDFRPLWTGPERYDFSAVDRAMAVILAADPEAYVILCCGLYAPEWWLQAHPDETMRYYGGEPRNPQHDFQSLSSRLWLEESQEGLVKFIAHVRRQPYAGRIIGMDANSGQTWEWLSDMGYGHDELLFSDFSPCAARAWRDWVRRKYRTEEALRRAWGDPAIRFDTLQTPLPGERQASDMECFLDPRKRVALMDYWQFRGDTVAGNIIALCGTIKEHSDRRWLTSVYYGYLNMISYGYNMLQETGHLGLDRVLQSPDVDCLTGPGLYHWRRLGLAHGFMQPAGSLAANGKLLICEMDQRTFTESLEVQWPNGRVDTVEETIGMMDRDFGLVAARGMGLHWMEMMGKWFREPVVQAAIGREIAAWQSLPAKSLGLTPYEVCVVSDLNSPLYTKLNKADNVHAWAIYEVLRRLNEAGFAWEQVLWEDLLTSRKVGKHKLYIMTNVLVLSPEERARIERRLRKERASVLWLYAPGAFTPDQPAEAANVSETIGMPVTLLAEKRTMSMIMDATWGGGTITLPTATGPWFLPVVTNAAVEVMGHAGDGQALMVRRKDGGRSVWFSVIPNLPPSLLRRIAQDAGVWIYAEGEDPLHIGNDLIFLHAKTTGEKRIRLPFEGRLRPLLGPVEHPVASGEAWLARPPLTYGFVVERK
jgi:hypothetical protein